LGACAQPTDGTWDLVSETGTLRVGMDASFPPFESIGPDGAVQGLDVDLARDISRRLDVEAEFVANLPYDGLYDALTARRVDIVISALVVNPSRTADYAYSRTYFNAGEVIVTRKENGESISADHLEGCSLAVVLGTVGDRSGRRWARRTLDLSLVQYRTPAEALRAVREGETDAALVDHVSAVGGTGEGSGLMIVGDPVSDTLYACAVRHDSVKLLKAVNCALRAIEDDGTLDQLITRWLR